MFKNLSGADFSIKSEAEICYILKLATQVVYFMNLDVFNPKHTEQM